MSASIAAEDSAPMVFRTPAWARYLSLIATVLVGGVSAAMLAFAVFLIFQRWWWLGLLFAALASFMAGLTGYVLRDLWGKWGLRVELKADCLVLDLPAGRSLIHRPVAQHLTIPFDDIEAVETRLEAYPTFGLEIMQRAYVLSCRQAGRIFLFEDRALGTALETPMVAQIAAAIVARARIPRRDLGMVEGRGGVLAVWGTHAPDWAAPALPLAQQARMWRHVAWTGTASILISLLALAIRLIIGR